MPRPLKHPDPADIKIESILYALSDPVRLEIVRMAAKDGEQPCNAFTDKIPKSTMSHHWRVLRESGVLRQRQEGVRRLNSLRKEELDRLFPGLLDAIVSAPAS